MNRNEILLAGGFKNLNSTSYINCTLQIFLHFKPFVQQINLKNPSKSDSDYSLIVSLQNLIKKQKNTDGSLSTDSIVSAMNIDPKISQTINNFFLYFQFSLSFNVLKFDFEDYENPINDQINLFIQNSKEFDYNDLNNNNFLYVHLQPNNQYIYIIDHNLRILDFSFTLYAVVNVILSPTSHNHYFVTIQDKNGWVLFNDTAVRNINNAQFESLLVSTITPVEVLIYIKDINDSEIIRTSASMNSTFVGLKTHSNQNETLPNYQDNNDDRDNYCEDIESVINRNNSSNDDCYEISYESVQNDHHTPIYQTNYNNHSSPFVEVVNGSSDDEPIEKRVLYRRHSRLIDSDPNRIRRIIESRPTMNSEEDDDDDDDEDENDDDDEISVEFFDASQMTFPRKVKEYKIPEFTSFEKLNTIKEKIERKINAKLRYTIKEKDHEFSTPKGLLYDSFSTADIEEIEDQKTAIFELQNMKSFDIEKVKNCETCQIYFSFIMNPKFEFQGKFVTNQTFEDIKNYVDIFVKEIYKTDSMFEVYLRYEVGCFKVSNNKKILEIMEIIHNDNLHFAINLWSHRNRPPFSIQLPVYQTIPKFKKITDFHSIYDIDSTCNSLVKDIKDKMIFKDKVAVMYYDQKYHKFGEIKLSEKIINLFKYPNPRIQQSQQESNSVVFEYRGEPFLLELRTNTSLDDLYSKISYYIGLDRPFKLNFFDVNYETVQINNNFLDHYQKKDYLYVEICD